jgi:uncharacterized cupin superfamily protein
MPLIQRVTRVGTTPEVSRPDPEKLISGDPVHTTWNLEETDGQSGYSILTSADGTVTQLHAGDSLIIRPGFAGTWEVVETTLKDYVIRL